MNNMWIILANETEAQIYNVTHSSEVELVKHLKHDANRLQNKEILSDRPSKADMPGNKLATFVPRADQHIIEQQLFAKDIAKFLDHGFSQHLYNEIIICSEPHFYGIVKSELSHNVVDKLRKHILKDYIPFPEPKLREALKELVKTRFQPAT